MTKIVSRGSDRNYGAVTRAALDVSWSKQLRPGVSGRPFPPSDDEEDKKRVIAEQEEEEADLGRRRWRWSYQVCLDRAGK